MNLHDRSTADDAFYEWLLSDHPSARAERSYRRAAYYEHQREMAATVRAWADKVNSHQSAPENLRELARTMGPRADQSALRAEIEAAEPDDLYVGRLRREFETYMQVSGPLGAHDYRYPRAPDRASGRELPATPGRHPRDRQLMNTRKHNARTEGRAKHKSGGQSSWPQRRTSCG